MKYTLISDLHLDFPQKKVPYDKFEKNVIIAGDTTNNLDCLRFFDKLTRKGFNVFAIDGNHEHYSNVKKQIDIEHTTEAFRNRYPNEARFDNIPIIGTNGWYQVSNAVNWFSYMTDPSLCIGGYPELAAAEMNKLAYNSYKYLDDVLAKATEKHIVVTHTSPCVETLDKKFEGHYSNEWFYNRLMYKILENHADKILVWNHGHTHAFADEVVNGVRVICNPRGYPNENPEWEPFTVEV